jgi:hypothetical protein
MLQYRQVGTQQRVCAVNMAECGGMQLQQPRHVLAVSSKAIGVRVQQCGTRNTAALSVLLHLLAV